jgi:hypothetical protein
VTEKHNAYLLYEECMTSEVWWDGVYARVLSRTCVFAAFTTIS